MLIKILFFYRLFMAFVAEFFIMIFLEKLGDTSLYIRSRPVPLIQEFGWEVLTDWVLLPRLIIGSVSWILHYRILVHLVFCSFAYYGIYKFLKAAKTANTKMYTVLILMCFTPSFAIWSSLAGKEAFIVFSMGIICAEIIHFFKGEKVRLSVPLVFAIWFICVIKFYYIPFIALAIVYIYFRQKLELEWYWDLAFLLFCLICCIGAIYMCRYKIDSYAINKLHTIYRVNDRSTRGQIFIEQFDFFKKMPVWIPISLWGPTLRECSLSFIHLCVFVESSFLLLVFLYMLKDVPKCIFSEFKVYCQWLVFGFNCVMLFVFAQYVQGVMNSGAAIRYRTNIFIPLLCFAYAFTCVQEKLKEKNEK